MAAPKGGHLERMSGSDLLSHTLASAVPSALGGLASGFGMEPGVSLPLWLPKLYGDIVPVVWDLGFPTVSREPHSGRVACFEKVKLSAY